MNRQVQCTRTIPIFHAKTIYAHMGSLNDLVTVQIANSNMCIRHAVEHESGLAMPLTQAVNKKLPLPER